MWYKDFADRLEAWSELRTSVQTMPLETALARINEFWLHAPWTAHYLHWDDIELWPDPWELLNDNIFCELARGLGILYTLSLVDHKDLTSAQLILTEEGYNLVQVNKEKYILNWDSEVIVNTTQKHKIKRSLAVEQLKQQYK
jgi:hypothetical protein